MTNEMIRPCTLWGYTFDAMSVTQVLSTENYIVVCLEDNTTFTSPFYIIQSQRYLQEAITTIADALNAPVLVKQAVLDAMEKVPEAKFKRRCESWFPQDGYDTCSIGWNGDSKRFEYASNFPLQIGDYIQADDCPLALQVLLGFTTEGVSK
jgi:hypothetical protein